MAKDFAKAFYGSPQWEKARAAYISTRIAKDGGMCERCHENLGYIVHHKIYLTPENVVDPEVALNFDNFEYLCHQCHDDEHIHRTPRLLCGFDQNGRPINAGSEKRDQNEDEQDEGWLRSDVHL